MTTKLSNFFRKKFYKFSDQLKSKSQLEDINMEQEFAQDMKNFKLKQQEFQKDAPEEQEFQKDTSSVGTRITSHNWLHLQHGIPIED